MNEQSLREKLSQTAYVERVFRRSINPACFGPGSRTAGVEPTSVKFQFDALGFAFYFEILAMAQDQVVDAATERREQFIIANIHCTEN